MEPSSSGLQLPATVGWEHGHLVLQISWVISSRDIFTFVFSAFSCLEPLIVYIWFGSVLQGAE